MGCDIHLVVEIKLDGKWIGFNQLNVPRNYSLFCRMAGVRKRTLIERGDNIEPISEPRGFPHDASELSKLLWEEYRPDGHSQSWLSSSEIKDLIKWVEEQGWKPEEGFRWSAEYFGCLFGNPIERFKPFHIDHGNIEDFRFLFWFDN